MVDGASVKHGSNEITTKTIVQHAMRWALQNLEGQCLCLCRTNGDDEEADSLEWQWQCQQTREAPERLRSRLDQKPRYY